MKSLWHRLTHAGVDDTTLPGDVRYITLHNTLSLIFTAMVIAFVPVLVAFGPRIDLVAFLIGGLGSLYAVPLVLNALKAFTLSRIFSTFQLITFVTVIAVFIGRDFEIHLFLLSGVFVLFAIVPPRQKGLLYATTSFVCAAYVGIQIWFEFNDQWMPRNPVLLLKYASTATVLMVIVAIAYYSASVVRRAEERLEKEYEKSERLLLNILPAEIAHELKTKGSTAPTQFDSVSVMFTDFMGFTTVAETLKPDELIGELDRCFSYFDSVTERYHLEKLKTIGDSFMCAGGVPVPNRTHAVDCVLAALEIQAFMNQMKQIKETQQLPYWEMRLGINSGPLVAGVIGEKKFVYDVWGDTVNTASRMESAGAPGRINISQTTFELVRDFFDCEYRGRIVAKNKGEVSMYFVTGILPDLARAGDSRVPNDRFREKYAALK